MFLDLVAEFSVTTASEATYNNGDKIQFETILSNNGGYYNPHEHAFICPVKGVYHFACHITCNVNSDLPISIRMGEVTLVSARPILDGSFYGSGSASVITSCDQGAKVHLVSLVNGGMLCSNANKYSSFSGYLLHQEYDDHDQV